MLNSMSVAGVTGVPISCKVHIKAPIISNPIASSSIHLYLLSLRPLRPLRLNNSDTTGNDIS